MGGASEIIYSLLMAHNNFMAPNINFNEPDKHSQKLDVIIETRESPIDIFLSNSFGFGGTNSTLIVKNCK
jgi:3-oxoacyl-[acyl-carrier-protein] synthase-1